jgi:hypothetical protein
MQFWSLMINIFTKRIHRFTSEQILKLSKQSQSQSHITTDGRSVCMSWRRAHSRTCDKIFFFLLQSYCLFSVGRPLWREVGSVICKSLSLQSIAVSQYLHRSFTFSIVRLNTSPRLPFAYQPYRSKTYQYYEDRFLRATTQFSGINLIPVAGE